MAAYQDITQAIGKTPLVKLKKVAAAGAEVWVKLEAFNPGGSVKDRIAFSMISAAERQGLLTKDTMIAEQTSGNSGIGLAMIAAVRGYRLILTMPETYSPAVTEFCQSGSTLVDFQVKFCLHGPIQGFFRSGEHDMRRNINNRYNAKIFKNLPGCLKYYFMILFFYRNFCELII